MADFSLPATVPAVDQGAGAMIPAQNDGRPAHRALLDPNPKLTMANDVVQMFLRTQSQEPFTCGGVELAARIVADNLLGSGSGHAAPAIF